MQKLQQNKVKIILGKKSSSVGTHNSNNNKFCQTTFPKPWQNIEQQHLNNLPTAITNK